MKGKKVIHSSSKSEGSTDNWWTPIPLFNYLDYWFNFVLDAAASEENSHCINFYSKEKNALDQNWIEDSKGGSIFCNPPYSLIENFTDKICEEYYEEKRSSAVYLVPARTCSKWFHKALEHCSACYLIKGRIKFYNPVKIKQNSAPFPSALFIFGKNPLKMHFPEGRIHPMELDLVTRGMGKDNGLME